MRDVFQEGFVVDGVERDLHVCGELCNFSKESLER